MILKGKSSHWIHKNFLDENFKLKNSRWKNVNKISIKDHKLELYLDKGNAELESNEKYVGYRLENKKVSAVILKNNNLHIEILINPNAFSAKRDPAGISDIIVDSNFNHMWSWRLCCGWCWG